MAEFSHFPAFNTSGVTGSEAQARSTSPESRTDLGAGVRSYLCLPQYEVNFHSLSRYNVAFLSTTVRGTCLLC